MVEEAKPPERRTWTTVVLIVLLVILVVIITPAILMSGRVTPERNPFVSLKTIHSAEEDFRLNDRDDNKVNDFWVGDVAMLYLMKGRGEQIRLIELSIAMADGYPSVPLPDLRARDGYRYAAMKTDETGASYDRGGGRNPEKFGFCAYPEVSRHTTDRPRSTFIINQQNTIWKKDLGGAPAVKWPKDPVAEGWTKLD